MEVILQENVSALGFVGDVVKVKPGYARNFLFPKRLAVPANKANVLQFEHQKKVIAVKIAKKKGEADEVRKRLEAVEIVIAHATSDDEKLFGSVTTLELQEKLTELGFAVDRKLIRVETPIRTIGIHEVEVKLHQDVTAKVKVNVQAKA